MGVITIIRPTKSEEFECRVDKNFEGDDRSLPQDSASAFALRSKWTNFIRSLEAEGDFIQVARYISDNRHSIAGTYVIFPFTITYRTGVHTTSLLGVPVVIYIRVKWPQCETYCLFSSNGLSQRYIARALPISYPKFVHRSLSKENTLFWKLDLLPPSCEGMGRTYLVGFDTSISFGSGIVLCSNIWSVIKEGSLCRTEFNRCVLLFHLRTGTGQLAKDHPPSWMRGDGRRSSTK